MSTDKNKPKPVIRWVKRSEMLAANIPYKDQRITPPHILDLNPGEIFVFGTDGRGEHSFGSARYAADMFGAVPGHPEGLQGRSYAIPTEYNSAEEIRPYVERFTAFARTHPRMTFLVTPIGCGAAGHTPQEIAPLFIEASDLRNVSLPESFWEELNH